MYWMTFYPDTLEEAREMVAALGFHVVAGPGSSTPLWITTQAMGSFEDLLGSIEDVVGDVIARSDGGVLFEARISFRRETAPAIRQVCEKLV